MWFRASDSAYQDAFEVDVIFLGGLLVLLQDDV